jgi:hypothetical protein
MINRLSSCRGGWLTLMCSRYQPMNAFTYPLVKRKS